MKIKLTKIVKHPLFLPLLSIHIAVAAAAYCKGLNDNKNKQNKK